mgnify:CR=1 FL=1
MLALTSRQRFLASEYASGVLLLPVCAYFALVPYGEPGGLGALWFVVQLVFPCIWLWIAFANDTRVGVQVCLVWLGQNWIDVAAYASDAQARQMPLLGGLGPEAHDWHNLLSATGLLDQTPLVAAVAMPVSSLLVVALARRG